MTTAGPASCKDSQADTSLSSASETDMLESSDCEEPQETVAQCSSSSSSRYFSAQQRAVLNTYYKNGMRGVGKCYEVMLEHASKEAGLNSKQVKVTHTARHTSDRPAHR